MKKVASILVLLAIAGAASGETIWAVSSSYTGAQSTRLFSFESTTGVFVNAPSALLPPKVGYAYGLAVAGDLAYLSYGTPDGSSKWIGVYDLTTMTQVADVQIPFTVRGLNWDGSKLLGGKSGTNEVVQVGLSGTTPTGTVTSTGAILASTYTFQYYGTYVGLDPATGEYWGVGNHNRWNKWVGEPSGVATYVGTRFDDQIGSATFTSDGIAQFNHIVGYTILRGVPGTNDMSAPDYNLNTVNSYTFDGAGVFGMSIAGPAIPEPATMGLLLVGGIGALLRKRR